MGAAGGNRGMTDNSLSDIENFREPDNYIPKRKIYENNIKVQKNLNPKNSEIKKKKKNKKNKKKKNDNYNDDNLIMMMMKKKKKNIVIMIIIQTMIIINH